MKNDQDYIRDLAEIRSMMARSSKFVSLSGWAGIMAGIYALAGSWIAFQFLDFNPTALIYSSLTDETLFSSLTAIMLLGLIILILTFGTAVFLSDKKAGKSGEKLWNATSKIMLINLFVPLTAGGLLILVLISNGLIGLVLPFSLIFYGLALYNAGKFTFEEIKTLGLLEIGLGLISSFFVDYGLLCWALGFGVLHIIYGIYMHYRYER